MRRLILFSGMGADSRLLAPLSLPELDLVTPEHLEPGPGESLAEYAARCAEAAGVGPDAVVGGASFGGMIAAEIARQRPVAGLVLLGSCLDPRRLPSAGRLLARWERWIPDFALGFRTWGPFLRRRFEPLTPEAERCVRSMAEDCPPSRLREFGRMIFGWEGVSRPPCPVLALNADRDRIIPPRAAPPGLTLKDAGHVFTLTHAAETSEAIRRFVSSLPAFGR